MKSSLAIISVAIRILIRFLLLLLIFSQKSSSSKAGFLEALFGLSILGDPIVGRVLAAFGSGVANPLVGMMLTRQMVVFAIHNLSDRFFLLGKDLLPSPFFILVLLCFAGIPRSVFVLLRSSKAVLVILSQDWSHREQVESLRFGTYGLDKGLDTAAMRTHNIAWA
jgi:branched-subunit amino acid transport protein AzlD